ncbi:MAG: hypothetical protein NTY42_10660 [Planctomycetota bacterium]|nr:hypothetical protein [Planctomycetota bacterium]
MSRTPPTRRDYESAIEAIVLSRREVQKLIDATHRDEEYILSLLGPILSNLEDAQSTLLQLRS